MAANTSQRGRDAALALVAHGVDAICQIPGNLTAAAFPSIAQAARRARVPIFAFQSSQAQAARWWRWRATTRTPAAQSAEPGGAGDARRIAGGIPFGRSARRSLIVNLVGARADRPHDSAGGSVAKADEVIGRR